MEKKMWEVIVVGGGPAGLTTAIMCASRHLDTLILEGGKWGGLPATLYPSKIIPNYPGFPDGISGIELVRRWIKHAKESEFVTMKKERVVDIEKNGIVKTEEGEYHGKTIVIATGTRPRELGIPGEAKYNKEDKGVYYYVTHREDFIGTKTLVVGGGDTAVDAALDLVDLADEIYIAHRRDKFRALDENVKKMEESNKITILYNTEIEEIRGSDKVEEVAIINNKTNEKKVLKIDKVVLAVGLTPNVEIFSKLGIEMDDRGYIITDLKQRTNVKGVFAVGDVVKGAFRLLVVGAAHGAIASQKIYEYIRRPYWAGEDEK
ncbi:thioredoxin-disulfide reductase [Thermoplasmatales archaeon ex4484_30]|nr:MAG: thioredoxin-disulfide reductase [Thermoplasmatales archaeon ex4484_30]